MIKYFRELLSVLKEIRNELTGLTAQVVITRNYYVEFRKEDAELRRLLQKYHKRHEPQGNY